jgi:hypothetical protein
MFLKRIAVLIACVSLSPSAHAMPKQGGTHACGCLCDVTLGNGRNVGVAANFQLPLQYGCGAATNTVCNVSDPTTGGVAQGILEGCSDGYLTSTTHTIPLSTFHGPLRGVNAPPNR